MSLTDFGKQPGPGVRALGSGSPSPKASSKLTADASGSRAQRGSGSTFFFTIPKAAATPHSLVEGAPSDRAAEVRYVNLIRVSPRLT